MRRRCDSFPEETFRRSFRDGIPAYTKQTHFHHYKSRCFSKVFTCSTGSTIYVHLNSRFEPRTFLLQGNDCTAMQLRNEMYFIYCFHFHIKCVCGRGSRLE
ncbi:hypothetical protein ILYODFUR_023363, partial [Ilyodon furcidens]